MSKNEKWAYLYLKSPRPFKDWLQKRAAKELTSVSALVRRVMRNYMMQVDRPAYDEMVEEMEDGR
jgi:hypothetical protein